MERLAALNDELAFLENHLPELQVRPDLASLAAGWEKRVSEIRQQIRAAAKGKNSGRDEQGSTGRSSMPGMGSESLNVALACLTPSRLGADLDGVPFEAVPC